MYIPEMRGQPFFETLSFFVADSKLDEMFGSNSQDK
jgi:hypothetical protein